LNPPRFPYNWSAVVRNICSLALTVRWSMVVPLRRCCKPAKGSHAVNVDDYRPPGFPVRCLFPLPFGFTHSFPDLVMPRLRTKHSFPARALSRTQRRVAPRRPDGPVQCFFSPPRAVSLPYRLQTVKLPRSLGGGWSPPSSMASTLLLVAAETFNSPPGRKCPHKPYVTLAKLCRGPRPPPSFLGIRLLVPRKV